MVEGKLGGHLQDADETTVKLYFQYYGKLANQMNMLQDYTRTSAYMSAICDNKADFLGRTVMDVGAGSGILSFFAVKAGAERVFAVEASNVATAIERLKEANMAYGSRINVIAKPLEAIDPTEDLRSPHTPLPPQPLAEVPVDAMSEDNAAADPPKVDVLVSEPIGTFLFNERMIETYLYARDHFLKPGGAMYPNKANLYLSLFSDAALYAEISHKVTFWENQNFYGLDISSLVSRAAEEAFEQPILDFIDRQCLIGSARCETFDFKTLPRGSLAEMTFNLDVPISSPALIHGVAGWFDIVFDGPNTPVTLSTAPWNSPTHWHQIRFMLKQPLAVNAGQRIVGTLHMKGHSQQSYNVKIKLNIEGTDFSSESAVIDLKDPDYRWFCGTNSSGTAGGSTQPTTATTAQYSMPASSWGGE